MDLGTLHIPIPLALAVVATLGYLFGRRRRAELSEPELVARSRRDLLRAQHVAGELERVASTVRRHLAAHQAGLLRFKDRVARLAGQPDEALWKDLCREAEEILRPTLQLATQLAHAYDEVRQQSSHLMTFTEVRTDPLTGVKNRRGLEDALATQLAMMTRYCTTFSVAMFDIDYFKALNDREGHLYGDRVLQDLARVFDESARETDVVARYGGEEFVVIMPQTDLFGAAVFAERVRARVAETLPATLSGGVTAALDGDTRDTLLARVDEALYAAKQAGRNCIWRHDGRQVEPVLLSADEATVAEPSGAV